MRRWLLVCLALAACAGPRSAPTPPGGLDVDGFRALMERSDRALARVRDRVVALVRGVLRRDALLRLDAGAESASAWAWTPKSNLAPRAGPPRGFHLGWIWIQEIQGWPLGQGQRRPPRHEKRTVSRHAGVDAPLRVRWLSIGEAAGPGRHGASVPRAGPAARAAGGVEVHLGAGPGRRAPPAVPPGGAGDRPALASQRGGHPPPRVDASLTHPDLILGTPLYSSRRPDSARARVAWSANSRSPPIGRP